MQSIAVGVVSIASLFVTPAGFRTAHYYAGVFDNEAAARGAELWARPDLTHSFDLVMVVAAAVLLVLALSSRLPVWEYLLLAGLVLATAVAARNGVWLALALFLPAARGRQTAPAVQVQLRPLWCVAWLALVLAACGAVSWSRPDRLSALPPEVSRQVRMVAADRVVLAPEPAVEQLAADGLTIWLSDPIDAFDRADQAAYLDFLEGAPAGQDAIDAADLVLVKTGSHSARLVEASPGWRISWRGQGWQVYTR